MFSKGEASIHAERKSSDYSGHSCVAFPGTTSVMLKCWKMQLKTLNTEFISQYRKVNTALPHKQQKRLKKPSTVETQSME